MRSIPVIAILIFGTSALSFGQTDAPAVKEARSGPSASVSLEVPVGTPLPVVFENEVRIRKTGQAIRGKIAEPVYAFDKLVVPAGSEVTGSVTRIAGVSVMKRTMSALDANFSPVRDVEITFDQLALPDGRRVPIHTQVSPASQSVLGFATAADIKDNAKEQKESAVKKAVSGKVSEKKQEISKDWQAAKAQITAPGKMHRLKRIVIAQMPVHPQYFDAGTRFNAELLEPLNFGTEEVPAEKMLMVGTTPAAGSIIHALLKTPLDSATTQKGADIEAVMTEPLFTNSQLVLPEGTVLKGSVLQVQPARSMHRNGQLRIVFHQVEPPQAAEQQVEASLEGVEVKSDQKLSLDEEGGAQATSPKTRYLTTGITLALAGGFFDEDEALPGAANGASGFRVIGILIGALARSRALTSAFGVYGAAKSVYGNFLSRGHDVVYPKDTAMAIGFGSRVTGPPKPAPQTLLPSE